MKEFKCPDALAEYYKPYSCRIHQWILEHVLFLVPVCTLVFHSCGWSSVLAFLTTISRSLLTVLRSTACGFYGANPENSQETVFVDQSGRTLSSGSKSAIVLIIWSRILVLKSNGKGHVLRTKFGKFFHILVHIHHINIFRCLALYFQYTSGVDTHFWFLLYHMHPYPQRW